MAGLVPAIHADPDGGSAAGPRVNFSTSAAHVDIRSAQSVDARDRPGHDKVPQQP
jgi:hypothetical protein